MKAKLTGVLLFWLRTHCLSQLLLSEVHFLRTCGSGRTMYGEFTGSSLHFD